MVNKRHNEAILSGLHEVETNPHIAKNLPSSFSIVTVVVDGFNMTALSPVVRDTLKDSAFSSTLSPTMGIITVRAVLPLLNVRSVDTVV